MPYRHSSNLLRRFVKVRAGSRGQPDGGPYRLSTGFIVREGVVITSAHGVHGAPSITIVDLHRGGLQVRVEPDSIWLGHPEGPAVNKPPDIALIFVSELGVGLTTYPIARLSRTDVGLTTLRDVHVLGFPAFMETDRRNSFHDEGTISLLSNVESGLVDVTFSTAPGADPRTGLRSPWSGISGAPVLLGGHLIAIITEHSPRMGSSRLSATPLSLLDSHVEWPGWGPGVQNPEAWWASLGVDPKQLPVLPGEIARAEWVADLRQLADTLNDQPQTIPQTLRTPARFALQAHEAIIEALQGVDEPEFTEVGRRLQRTVARPAAVHGTSIYAMSLEQILTSRSLEMTCDKLLAIHKIASTIPRLDARLKYRINTPRIELEDLENELWRWAAQSKDEDLARAVVMRLDVTTAKDPYGDLLARLSNAKWVQSDPVRSIHDLVNLIFEEDVYRDLGNKIERCFAGQRTVTATMFTSVDVEPETIEVRENGFLVNEQPTLVHLRDGYFAPAVDLDAVVDSYWNWYKSEVVDRSGRVSGRIPTFWLTGPSGAGKSILLLQLLARLNSSAGVSVLLPGAFGDRLASIAQHTLSLSQERHVVIGVDDPLTATSHSADSTWRAIFEAFGHLRQTASASALPVFICCAPTEQYERFRSTFAGSVQIGRYNLDPYSTRFIDGLRSWYEERTRHSARLPAKGKTLLPAQLFFEWWKGEGIDAFARRFRERITAQGLPELADFFYRLLAVNRLYVGYAPEAVQGLPPAVQDALSAFELDLHLNQPTITRPGYWLSHPHLANIIYEDWFPNDSHHELRGHHLAAALVDAVSVASQGWASLPLLEELLARMRTAGGSAMESRVDLAQIAVAVRAAAAVAGGDAAAIANVVLATWVGVEQWVPQGLGSWQPRVEAVARVRAAAGDEPGLSALLMALAEVGSTSTDDVVWTFLNDHPHWHGWMSTAELLANRIRTQYQVEAVARAVEAQKDEPQALDLLGTALRRHGNDSTLRTLAYDLVKGRLRSSASVASLAAVLFSIGGRSEDIALEWLRADLRRENGTVLAEALRRNRPPGIAWSELGKWLIAYPAEEASDLGFARMISWLRLMDRDFQDAFAKHLSQRGQFMSAELLEALWRLLSEDHRIWSFIFASLTSAQVRKTEIRSAAVAWLMRNEDSAAWHHVYVHLCNAFSRPDLELVQVGEAHLPLAWNYLHCSHIFGAMIRLTTQERLPQTAHLALDWLTTHPNEHDGWGYLARPVIQATSVDDINSMVKMILNWWLGHQLEQSASYVLRAMLNSQLEKPLLNSIIDYAEDWLQISRPGWGHVFLDLFPLLSSDRAVAIAMPWLMREPNDDRWAAVFGQVIDYLSVDQTTQLARAWFAACTEVDSTAGFLWRIVLEEGPCQDLLHDKTFREAVNAWLVRRGHLKSWWHIWREMHKAEPDDLETVRAALTADLLNERAYGVANSLKKTIAARSEIVAPMWDLMRTTQRGETWRLVWVHLTFVAPTPTCWELGLSELPNLPPDHFSSWWRRLWNTFGDAGARAHLRSLGRVWLKTQPDGPPREKVAEKIREDDSVRITPASVFGSRRSPAFHRPVATAATILDTDVAESEPSHSDRGHSTITTEVRLECAQCRAPIEFKRPVERWVCLDCGASLTVNLNEQRIEVRRILRFRAAFPVGSNSKKPRQARAIVHCDGCGRDLLAIIRTLDAQIAIDDECGFLHKVPVQLLNEWLSRPQCR